MPIGLHNKSLRPKRSLRCDGLLVFKYVYSNSSYLHFLVGRPYGNAIKRNLLKRRSRNLYLNLLKKLDPLFLGLSIYPIKKNISFKELKGCFALLEKKMN